MTEFLSIDGITIESKWFLPEPNGKPAQATDLVLLHEGLGCVELWRDVPQSLATLTNRRVFVYSRQGYGQSDPCDLPRPIDFMHREGLNVLPRVLDAAEIERCALIGHSDGGSIALINAGGTKDPRVQSSVTIAAHVFIEQISVDSIEAARIAYDTGDLREKLARYHGENVDCAFRGWNEVWLDQDFIDWNLEEFLPGVEIPLLVIQGESDEYGTQAQVDAIADGCAGPLETWIVPGARHSPHLDARDDVLRRIAEFIDRTTPASAKID